MDWEKCFHQGKVDDTPQLTEYNGTKYVTFTLTVKRRVPAANNQYVDKQTIVPFYATDRKAEVIHQHVTAGREVMIESIYNAWENDGRKEHAFQVISISFGYQPRQNPQAV